MAARKLVICLDGTGQQIGSASQPTNPAKVFQMLDLSDPSRQLAYYDPGVGTLASSTARGKLGQAASRVAQLGFGRGMRDNLTQAYTWLMQHYVPGDEIYVFGFSRGAYTARALIGMLARPGLMRPGSENLVDYAVREYATNRPVGKESEARRNAIQAFADAFCWGTEHNPLFAGRWQQPRHHEDWHCVPVAYLGAWDTVKAAGFLGIGNVKWPYTHQLFNAEKVRHAVSIDEHRRPYHEYLVQPRPGAVEEVWFSGVHSDVGGTYDPNCRLALISLKWVVEAVADRLYFRQDAFDRHCPPTSPAAAGDLHRMGRLWDRRARDMRPPVAVHDSVRQRIADPALRYRPRLPDGVSWADPDWQTSRPVTVLTLPPPTPR